VKFLFSDLIADEVGRRVAFFLENAEVAGELIVEDAQQRGLGERAGKRKK